jgi:hypothetical protein
MFRVPELQIPHALPRPRVQLPVRNRNRDARADECGFDMCLGRSISHDPHPSIPHLDSQAYHHSPPHHVDTTPSFPLYPQAQCDPAHHPYPPLHPRRNSHSGSARRTCAARTDSATRSCSSSALATSRRCGMLRGTSRGCAKAGLWIFGTWRLEVSVKLRAKLWFQLEGRGDWER